MASGFYLWCLAIGCILTGGLNSLFTKYQDNQCVRNCEADPNTHETFEQPALQTLQMFVGEVLCFLVYRLLLRSRKSAIASSGYQSLPENDQDSWNFYQSLKLSLPAIYDLCGTTLLNIGLVYTPVSIYQMIRGSLVLFVALLSVLVLKRKITKLEWISLFIVTLGVAIVGLSGSRNTVAANENEEGSPLLIIGIVLIVFAEFCQSFQFVIEEKLLSQKSIEPLKLVYFEGLYGASLILFAMVILNFIIRASTPAEKFVNSPFNMRESFAQFVSSPQIFVSSVLIMLSIAAFNFCGVSLTNELSATARSTIDTCRTMFVWIFAMLLGWESFHWLQFFGFVALVFGTFCFNGVLNPELWSFVPRSLKSTPHVNVLDTLSEPLERTYS